MRHQVASKVTIANLKRARRNVKRLASEDARLRSAVARRKWKVRRLKAQLALLTFVLQSRQALDNTLMRAGAFFISLAVGAAISLLATFLAGGFFLACFVATIAGALFAAGIMLPLAFYPVDAVLEAQIPPLSVRLAEAINQRAKWATTRSQHRPNLDAARAEYRRIKRAIDSRLNRLRTSQWQSMTGYEFERFLADVFRERGYGVELMGRSGDQGVDLVVTRGGDRIAIQAKGYTAGNVGNKAVQEVHTGMTHYRCGRSVVVTNSGFTRGAQELASSVGCRLIDGSQIPGLIDGRISL